MILNEYNVQKKLNKLVKLFLLFDILVFLLYCLDLLLAEMAIVRVLEEVVYKETKFVEVELIMEVVD